MKSFGEGYPLSKNSFIHEFRANFRIALIYVLTAVMTASKLV